MPCRAEQPAKPFASRRLAAAIALAATLCAGEAFAQADSAASAQAESRPHAVYLELLGKGGAWGAGYDYLLRGPLAVGATTSFSVLSGQRIFTLSPYLAGYPVAGERHRMFLHLGPQLAHVATPSPFPEWSGTSSTELGAQLSVGWEYRARLLLRAYGLLAYGKGGFGPWLGFTVGWTF